MMTQGDLIDVSCRLISRSRLPGPFSSIVFADRGGIAIRWRCVEFVICLGGDERLTKLQGIPGLPRKERHRPPLQNRVLQLMPMI